MRDGHVQLRRINGVAESRKRDLRTLEEERDDGGQDFVRDLQRNTHATLEQADAQARVSV